jgi:hypothetical protein
MRAGLISVTAPLGNASGKIEVQTSVVQRPVARIERRAQSGTPPSTRRCLSAEFLPRDRAGPLRNRNPIDGKYEENAPNAVPDYALRSFRATGPRDKPVLAGRGHPRPHCRTAAAGASFLQGNPCRGHR